MAEQPSAAEATALSHLDVVPAAALTDGSLTPAASAASALPGAIAGKIIFVFILLGIMALIVRWYRRQRAADADADADNDAMSTSGAKKAEPQVQRSIAIATATDQVSVAVASTPSPKSPSSAAPRRPFASAGSSEELARGDAQTATMPPQRQQSPDDKDFRHYQYDF